MSSMLQSIPREIVELRELGILRDIDLYLAASLERCFGGKGYSATVLLAVCLVNRVLADGHICLDLEDVTPEWLAAFAAVPDKEQVRIPSGILAALGEIASARLAGEGIVGAPDAGSPLVLGDGRLYLRRYWNYEQTVAARLAAMARTRSAQASTVELQGLQINEGQSRAVLRALAGKFVVISGGPGTGKTYTAARILCLLAERAPIIRMAAPTGKAADRLNESVREALKVLGRDIELEDACTIERLLGYVSNSPYFKHNRENPLPADVVLIDEASMVDLPKMAKLLGALAPDCRLILLGDMHQLASVAPGSVLGDICSAAALEDSVVELTDSRRFAPGGPIARLSAAINASESSADALDVWEMLRDFSDEGALAMREVPESFMGKDRKVDPAFAAAVIDGFRDFTVAETPEDAFEALDRFRVLCAMRRGPHGVETVNRLIEDILAGRAVGGSDGASGVSEWRRLRTSGEFYDHRVVMITRNDYSMGLFNGDVGIIMKDHQADGEGLAAYFRGRAGDSPCRRVPCRLLPRHETAFAVTVHKSQGSEYDSILVVLPNRDSPVVTKELIYTAITRTRNNVEIWCSQSAFTSAVCTRIKRASGLSTRWRGF